MLSIEEFLSQVAWPGVQPSPLGGGEVMEACLWNFYGGWIFEPQRGPSMVIFHHGDAAEGKREEERGD